MASKFEVIDNESPERFDAIEENSPVYLSEKSQFQEDREQREFNLKSLRIAAERKTNEEYFDKYSNKLIEDKDRHRASSNLFLTPKQKQVFRYLIGAAEKQRTASGIKPGIRLAYPLLYNDRILSRHGLRRRKLSNTYSYRQFPFGRNLNFNEPHVSTNENSVVKLKHEFKQLQYDVPLKNTSPEKSHHVGDSSKIHISVDKITSQNSHLKFRKSRGSELQKTYSNAEGSIDTRPLWNSQSANSLVSTKVNVFDNSRNSIDHVDVFPISTNSNQFSSGLALGLFGLFFVLAVFVYWIKNIIFGLTSQKKIEKKSKRIETESGSCCIENESLTTSSSKKNLFVFHKTSKESLSTKLITRHSSHSSRKMDIDARSDSNIDDGNFERNIGNSSNKSTPYFTPLGTLDESHTKFEFPLPSPPSTGIDSKKEWDSPMSPAVTTTIAVTTKPLATNTASRIGLTKHSTVDAIQSPTRRLRRCSLYERRSCSPQRSQVSNLLINRSLCKSQMESYEQMFNTGATMFSNQVKSAISAIALNSSLSPVEICGKQFSFSRQNCRSPRIYENRSIDADCDKENEIPIKAELCSPKLKTSDLALFQPNSPRIFESSPTSTSTNFSFSPKIIENTEIKYNGPNLIGIKSSPLSSAGYKNGEYFKFPEVDCFSPDPKKKPFASGAHDKFEMQDKAKLNSSSDCQASRRARLKSISLDSEGAKLVEDNLGVPVEELIERANPVANNLFSQSNSPQHTVTSKLSESTSSPSSDTIQNHHSQPLKNSNKTQSDFNRKNENNLTIVIGNYTDVNQNQQQETQQKVSTPKTPTLAQTKQKAISLDSSDSKFTSAKHFTEDQNDCIRSTNKNDRPLAVSLLHVSSLSMPGTPKRHLSLHKNVGQQLNRSKFTSSLVGSGGQKSKARHFSSSKSLTPSTPSTASFDHSKSSERQGFILKLDSFNENTMDDADYDEEEQPVDGDDEDNYFLNFDDVSVANEDNISNISANDNIAHVCLLMSKGNSYDVEDNRLPSANVKKLSSDYLLGSSLQTQKCTTVLSLSNSNLKTLPEVMTLSDFSMSNRKDDAKTEKRSTSAAGYLPSSVQKQSSLVSGRSVRSSLLQRRGSNHSLTLNLNGSYGSLSKGLSTSNYSLGSNSQYNLSNSIYNLSQHQQNSFKTGQCGAFLKGNPVDITSLMQKCNTVTAAGVSCGKSSGGGSNICAVTTDSIEKKNLLQRRGSHTSLTLNIQGTPSVNLNRFNSHNSLNVTSQQHQNAIKIHHHQLNDMGGAAGGSTENTRTRKGLLERRGSNTSLTINLQNNALAVSNVNLRGSACSLSSINTNQLEEEYENQMQQDSSYNGFNLNSRTNSASVGKHRKFFSSENLNNLNGMNQYSKLNQAHIRSSTNTCFGSVSDLKPYCQLPLSLIIGEDQETHFKNQFIESKNGSAIENETNHIPVNTKEISSDSSCISNFKQSNLCSCTGVRNITTRPLSPQTTSEDFKMYLANIQLLQNASNVLNEYDLIRMSYMFDESYMSGDGDLDSVSVDKQQFEEMYVLDSGEQIELPTKDKQKSLLRNLHQEFWDLPTNHQEKPMVFGSQAKNRYKSILPNEHSRVQLLPEEGNTEAPYINANYIKGADYVQKSYIATQGPLPSTIYEFWLMVFQNVRKYDERNVAKSAHATESETTDAGGGEQKIVMLTNFVENNRSKCSPYFPIDENQMFLITCENNRVQNPDIETFYGKYFDELGNQMKTRRKIKTIRIEISDKNLLHHLPNVNYFIIKNLGITTKNGFSIRKLQCLFCSNVVGHTSERGSETESNNRIQYVHSFNCYHYWYPDWPDHRSPSDISVLLEISQHLLQLDNYEAAEFFYGTDRQSSFSLKETTCGDQPLPIIHCSAGIGRTGCMAAILNAICQIRTSISPTHLNPMGLDTASCRQQISKSNDEAVNNYTTQSNDDGNMCDLDNPQSFPSQSFPYSKLSNSDKIKISKTRNSNIIGCNIVDIKHNDPSNNMYCEAIKKTPNIYVDILGIVCNLRLQRGGMVQNSEQYELIHRAMCLYFKRVLKYLYESKM